MGEAPKKVLIVDDEEILTWIMSKTLSKDKDIYEILVANDGNKALEILKKEPIDLVVSDIRMPGLSGLDVLEEIRNRYPQTKVVIMTAYGNPDVQKEANKRGCLHYLEKPFKIEELRTLILDSVQEKKKGFEGKVADFQITDIIQLNCIGRTTTAISVKKDNHEGIIYFKDGEIVHAEVDETMGEEALFIILGWEGGDFTTLTGAKPLKETISSNWQELLMEGMRRKDEALEKASSDLPDLRETISQNREDTQRIDEEVEEQEGFDALAIDFGIDQPIPQDNKVIIATGSKGAGSISRQIPKEDVSPPKTKETPAPKATRDRKSLLKQILIDLRNSSEEIEGAAVVTIEGLPLGYDLPNRSNMDHRRLGAIAASLFKAGEKSVSGTHTGMIKELQIIAAEGSLHIYPVGKKILLVVMGSKECNIGMVQVESMEACKKIVSIIKRT